MPTTNATLKTRFSAEVQAAFQCTNCNNEIHTLSYKLVTPEICGNCNHTDFKKLWAQKIKTQTTVESL